MTAGHPPTDPHATRDGYDRWSDLYDSDDNPLVGLEAPRMAELLGDVAGLRVAELGCGTGRHTARLAAAGARVTALDFSQGMLDRARAKPQCRDVTFIAHDLAQRLPLPDAAFDRTVCGLVLDHITGLAGLLGEMRRITAPGGFAVVSVMHPAMSLLGVQARFTDPATGKKVLCGSAENSMSDYIRAVLAAGWTISHISEHAVDDELIGRMPRAARYRGWPMLLMLKLA